MWKIAGFSLQPGEKRRVTIEIPVEEAGEEKMYPMPATLICGCGKGKTVLITAGIHAGEYPAIPAVIQAAGEIQPEGLNGNLIFIHCVNTSGFFKRTFGLIPEDDFNLNGQYPGKEGGTTGERIADYFVRNFFDEIDFMMDMHSGGQQEPLTPCLFYPLAEAVTEEALAAARALDIPWLIASTATAGQYSYAANYHKVPGLLVERGYGGFCKKEWVDAYYRDIFLLLKHLKMYGTAETEEQVCKKTVVPRTIYLTSDTKGIWHTDLHENMEVARGELLGYCTDFYGEVIKNYYAEEDGVVFYYNTGLSVEEGTTLVAYGIREYMIADEAG